LIEAGAGGDVGLSLDEASASCPEGGADAQVIHQRTMVERNLPSAYR
jgi:hypothetical protein